MTFKFLSHTISPILVLITLCSSPQVFSQKLRKHNAQDSFIKAKEAEAGNNYDDAYHYYSEAIALDPENFEYRNSRGILHFRFGKYYYAISDFISAIELEPNNHLPHYNLGYSIYRLEDFQPALAEATKTINLKKDFCDAYNLKGLIYNHMGKNDSAEIFYYQAYLCDSTEIVYSYNTGLAKYNQGQYADALHWFVKAYENGYDSDNILSYIGNCYDQTGNYEMAVEYHTVSIFTSDSSAYIPFYNRGLAFFNSSFYTKALKDFEQAYRIDTTDADIVHYLALVNDSLGNNACAQGYYDKLIRMGPTNAEYYDLRADFYKRLEAYQKAVDDYQVSVSLYPDDCNIYLYLTELFEKINEPANARKYIEKAKSLGCNIIE